MDRTASRRVAASAACMATALAGSVTAIGRAAAEPLNRCSAPESGNPVLDSLTMSPQVVDARQASQQVRVTAEAHDTGGPGPRTGVRSIRLWLTNGRWLQMRYTGGRSWVASTTVPRWSKTGRWAVQEAFLADGADFSDRTPDLEEDDFDVPYGSGYPHTWAEVAGDRDIEVLTDHDDMPPRITDVDLYPPRVDTRAKVTYVYVTTRAFDSLSGVRDGRMDLAPGGLAPTIKPFAVHLRPLPGRHGLMRGRFLVPRRVSNAPWRIWGLTVRDNAGRRRTLTVEALRDARYPTALRVVSRRLPPAGKARIRSVTASVRRLDVRTRDQAVTYRIRATNGLGLVREVNVGFPFFAGVTPTRPRLVSGNRHDGIWTTTAVVDSCLSPGGVLTSFVTAFGRLNQDEREGPPIRVLAGDNSSPRALGLEAVDGDVVVQFTEEVNGISTASVPVRYGVSGQLVTGSWTCRAATDASTPCLSGAARTAIFMPDAALPPGEHYTAVVNPHGNLDVTDLNGNPVVRQSLLQEIE